MRAFRQGRAALRGLAFLILLLSPVFAEPALAGNFSVSPVRVALSSSLKVAAMRVFNGGAEPISIQLQLVEWDQQAGQDVYTPTVELLATPPIFTIPAGQSQVIRVGLRRPPDLDHELTYRLILQEIPPPLEDGFQGLRMALRISVPVFVAPLEGEPAPDLQWRVARDGGALALTAVNNGTAHGQVTNLRLRLDGHQFAPSDNTYILPGKRHTWHLPAVTGLADAATLELTATLNGSEIIRQLPLE